MHKNHKKGGGVLYILLKEASSKLKNISDSPTLDAELLLAHCLQKNRTYLHTWPEKQINNAELNQFNKLIEKRLTDYPVAYLLGYKSFWTLDLVVTPDVLIPRPETELLVETALEIIKEIRNPKVLDLGTGSGAIALAIASERTDVEVTATDCSRAALAIATMNAKNNQLLSQVEFIQSNWFKSLDKRKYDLIVSNPPYIDQDDPHLLKTIRYEPQGALIAANAGMQDIDNIVHKSADYLVNNGWLILEHGFDQAEQTKKLFKKNSFNEVKTLTDLNNHERITLGMNS